MEHPNLTTPFYHLKDPGLKKIDRAKLFEAFDKLNPKVFKEYFDRANEPVYLYWDKLRFKQSPDGISPEKCWFLVREFRRIASKSTPIRSENGDYFTWYRLPYTEEFLHKIDVSSGGQIFTSLDVVSDLNKQKFISRGILEEAIASSQLEGAHTTHQVAKRMILERRRPRNSSEQMILNNFRTITQLDENYKKQPLSKELLIELHRMLTEKTIPKEQQGRFRRNNDDVVVKGPIRSQTYITHIPPSDKFVFEELDRLVEYANDVKDGSFVHPIVKAIFIHFWVGYLHPFTDGNGRLARALFYWYLLRKDYLTFMYLSISTIIKRAPLQYARACIYSDQDSNGATYFFDFHIKKIMSALDEFNNYVSRKIRENKEIDQIVGKELSTNDRQKYLIHHLISEESAYSTITSHATLNYISRQTAAKDIKELGDKGLLTSVREGKYIKYPASDDLLTRTSKNIT